MEIQEIEKIKIHGFIEKGILMPKIMRFFFIYIFDEKGKQVRINKEKISETNIIQFNDIMTELKFEFEQTVLFKRSDILTTSITTIKKNKKFEHGII